ncbi:MAG: site-2 protease family protein [Chloroflexota bacterium]
MRVADIPQTGKDWVATGVTMTLSTAVLAHQLGAWLAVGVMTLLLVHEMGHWVYARHAGIAVRSPLFVPFVGAFVRLEHFPASAEVEARLALAGPVAGGLAATILSIAGAVSCSGVLLEIGQISLAINLLNLVPMAPLDGGHVLEAMSPWPNAIGVVLVVGFLFVGRDWLLVPVVLLGAVSLHERFRCRSTAYYNTPSAGRVTLACGWGLAVVWLVLTWWLAH